ncbi:hypothetical protein GGI26_002706 [Coemansia sp. RSA 1358]|uniref:Uncharacterized protein n=1 Tax=Coemansia umbellata TaxID=1424467 RepID=A0ABQ8PIM6_9FUNG|nr:hypothetical protein EDC05_004397 [Coemansia umbellata]KAJ2623096.1 hypothetical protein GGI26_002706 [Coemansia sp. RSA 1358]
MVRALTILSTGLLVVWISILGSGGSLLYGWKPTPKALSPQVFGLLLWSRMASHQVILKHLPQPKRQLHRDPPWGALLSRPSLTSPDDAPRFPSHTGDVLLGDENNNYFVDNSVSNSVFCEKHSSDSSDSSHSGSAHIDAGSTKFAAAAQTSTLSLPNIDHQNKHNLPGQAKPMSMLLYRNLGSTYDLLSLLPSSTGAVEMLWQHEPVPTQHPTAANVTLIHPTTVLPSAQYRKRALALRRASGRSTKTLVAPEELTPSAILPQDPNGVTSMIAISTVLIFATFVAF